MGGAKDGDRVKVHYTGKMEDGRQFAATEDGKPLEFTVGSGKVIAGFERGVIGMAAGDKKTITISPEEGFGPRHEELLVDIRKSELHEKIDTAVGQQLSTEDANGNLVSMTIVDEQEDKITLDANHPLAGKTLKFTIQLIEVM